MVIKADMQKVFLEGCKQSEYRCGKVMPNDRLFYVSPKGQIGALRKCQACKSILERKDNHRSRMPGERKWAEHTQSASSLVKHFTIHSEMNPWKVQSLRAGSPRQSTDFDCAREGKVLRSGT